jgi:hypothetical protein
MVAVRVILGGTEGTVVVPGESAAAVAASPATVAPAPVVTSTVAVEPPRLYREADLVVAEADVMAVIPQFDSLLVTARAEWFVTDFFTVDGDVAGFDSLQETLPIGAATTWTHESGAGVSYVEWARAVSVDPGESGRFEVVVLFRALAGSDRGSLERQPVRAVAVVVAVDDSGAVAVADLPRPVALPSAYRVDAIAVGGEDVPEDVSAAAARTAATTWGLEFTVVDATLDQGMWRVAVLAADPSGLEWPLIVRLPAER